MELSTVHYIFSLVVLVINIAMFVAIKFNDLKHLEISVKDLKDNIIKNGDKVDSLSERISRMEGICSSKCKPQRKR